MTETQIKGVPVVINPWPFMKLMSRKRRLMSLAKDTLKPLFVSTEDENGTTKDMSDEEMFGMFEKLLSIFDEKTMEWFINTMLDGVVVGGSDMSDMQQRDLKLAGRSGFFYEICLAVFKENFEDFLELLATHLGLDLKSVLPQKKNEND